MSGVSVGLFGEDQAIEFPDVRDLTRPILREMEETAARPIIVVPVGGDSAVERPCENCGTMMPRNSQNKKYCSRQCMALANRREKPVRKCEICGAVIELTERNRSNYHTRETCGPECRSELIGRQQRRRHAERRGESADLIALPGGNGVPVAKGEPPAPKIEETGEPLSRPLAEWLRSPEIASMAAEMTVVLECLNDAAIDEIVGLITTEIKRQRGLA